MLPLAAGNARLEETTRIAGALIDGDDGDWLELRSKFVHTELQRVPDVAADIESKCSETHGSRDSPEGPQPGESLIRREAVSEIVQGSLQRARPIGYDVH